MSISGDSNNNQQRKSFLSGLRSQAAAAIATASLIALGRPSRVLADAHSRIPAVPQVLENWEEVDNDALNWADEDIEELEDGEERAVGVDAYQSNTGRGGGSSRVSGVVDRVLEQLQTPKRKIAAGVLVVGAAGSAVVLLKPRRGRGRSVRRQHDVPQKPKLESFDFDLLDENDFAPDTYPKDGPGALSRAKSEATVATRAKTAASDLAGTLTLDAEFEAAVASNQSTAPAPVQSAPRPAPAPMKTAPAPVPAPVPPPMTTAAPPAPAPAKKSFGLGLGSLFKKNAGSSRPSSLEAAIASSSDVQSWPTFSKAVAQQLLKSAPEGMFDKARLGLQDGGDDEDAVEVLLQLGKEESMTTLNMAESIANVVNAMVVALVDEAAASLKDKDPAAPLLALGDLFTFMDAAGGLFMSVCPGVELDPPIKYNGDAKKKALEDLFERITRDVLMSPENNEAVQRQTRLKDVLGLKESKVQAIEQKALMDLVQNMMKEGGGDASGLAGLMQGMGGGMPGGAMPDGPEMKAQMEDFKKMVKDGTVTREEVDELRKMYKDMGMDIDSMVKDASGAESQMDPDTAEMFTLLRGMLSQFPK